MKSKTTGEPIKDAFVAVYNEEVDEAGLKITDESGEYKVSGLVEGKYRVAAIANGYEQFEQSDIDISSGKETSLPISLEPQIVQSSFFNKGKVKMRYATLTGSRSILKLMIKMQNVNVVILY